MKIYSTKYIFTDGITEHEAEISGTMAITEKTPHGYSFYLHGEGKEWHKTKSSALERAEELRIKKLQSLDKQTKKISSMVFKC